MKTRSLDPWLACALAALGVWVATTLGGCRGPLESSLGGNASAELREEARACDNGDSIACSNVARAFEVGDGVAIDRPRAEAMYRVACDGGAWLACINLAAMLEEQGVIEVADELLGRACAAGDPLGCLRQGELVLRSADSVDDEARALGLLERACGARIQRACIEQARLIRAGRAGLAPDAHVAAVIFSQACESGEPIGCEELAAAYLEGDGMPQDTELGVATLERACISEHTVACRRLAALYREGSGVEANADEAARFERIACQQNDPDACALSGEGSD